MASSEPRGDVTLALTVRQLAVAAVAIVVLIVVMIQGRRWRAR
ncbi:MAG TPA: hypothetical protein VFO05_13445 [Candidatus Limnocylindrales bacterium]|nr:hypothetical protein [Candidatus Limnocylindrales bacterium]